MDSNPSALIIIYHICVIILPNKQISNLLKKGNFIMLFKGGMLTGEHIKKEVNKGNIRISHFDEKRLNPNSYNVRLHPDMYVYTEFPLRMDKLNKYESIRIGSNGYLLEPGKLYIGRTVEETATKKYIPMIDGRSSGGRLGISVHVCAGFGDIGFDGTWTLEITVVHPLIILPYSEIAQVSFYTPYGKIGDRLYSGKYQYQKDADTSKFYKDYVKYDD
jgi:dCTP deaminase